MNTKIPNEHRRIPFSKQCPPIMAGISCTIQSNMTYRYSRQPRIEDMKSQFIWAFKRSGKAQYMCEITETGVVILGKILRNADPISYNKMGLTICMVDEVIHNGMSYDVTSGHSYRFPCSADVYVMTSAGVNHKSISLLAFSIVSLA